MKSNKLVLLLLRTMRRIARKLNLELLILLRSFSSSEFLMYRKLRYLVLRDKPRFKRRNSTNTVGKLRVNTDKYLLWNNPVSGFSHQTSVYVMGFVLSRLLNRTVILNYMLLNLYHNREYDKKPILCDPKIFFNWEELNEAVKVISANDLSDLNCLYHSSIEHVRSIDINKQYDSDFILANNSSSARQFFPNDVIPDGIMKKCDSMTKYLVYSDDIMARAKRISDILDDYDAIHIRRGDMLFKDSLLLNNTLTPDEVATKTNLLNDINKLNTWIEPGRKLYIATDENDLTFFDELKTYYNVFFAKDFIEIIGNDKLPSEARNNSYYILCIEEMVLCKARRFVGTLPVSTTRKVDKLRVNFPGIDKNIYNLSENEYLEYAKNRDIWCVSFEELCDRIPQP